MARLPPNTEPSLFRPGQYVIHAGDGHIWYGNKRASGWHAYPAPNNPARFVHMTYKRGTLTALAGYLATLTKRSVHLDDCAFTTV